MHKVFFLSLLMLTLPLLPMLCSPLLLPLHPCFSLINTHNHSPLALHGERFCPSPPKP
ncbi:hypothetical protein AMTRI_Chr09g22580 [Amborella trichopoda]